MPDSNKPVLTKIAAVLLSLALCGAAFAGDQGKKKEKKPSDLERGLMLFEAGMKAQKAMRPIRPEEEQAIGHAVAKEVFLRYGRKVEDIRINKYVNLVGTAVSMRIGGKAIRYHFAVVANREANAFAAPGGYIFITTGLLKKLKSEAQLAGVLGHEMAHVTKKHMIKTIERSRKLSSVVEFSAVALNKDPGALSKVVGVVTETLFTRGLDRNFEFEADEVGTAYAAKAGYQAGGLRDFLIKLRAGEGKERSVFFQTHPPLTDRIARLNRGVLKKYGRGQVLAGRFKKTVK